MTLGGMFLVGGGGMGVEAGGISHRFIVPV